MFYEDNRYRFWNGYAIGINLKSIDNLSLLKTAFELKLRDRWRLKSKNKEIKEVRTKVIQALN